MSGREPVHLLEPIGGQSDRQIAQLRIPPHSVEAESSVLGSLLIDNSVWDRVGDVLTQADFYRHEHRLIFGAIQTLLAETKPADAITVYEHLQRAGRDGEDVGLAYVASLAQSVPNVSSVRRYAEIVRERAVLRRLITVADKIAALAFDPEGRTVADIVDAAQREVIAVDERAGADDDWHDMDAGMLQLLDRIERQSAPDAEPDFTPTGLADLDERLDGGMRAGELIVIGARPSMGKSALGETIATNVAVRHLPVAYFSFEMPAAQLHNRAMAAAAQIHLSRIKRPERLRDEDWPSIGEGVERLRKLPLHICDKTGLNVNALRAKARSLRRRVGKLGLIVVDYLGLMPGTDPKAPRVYQIEGITQGLKNLAKELGCPILLLVQVSRKAEERVDQMPILSDLRDSGSIEQDADIVVFVHRPFKANPELGDEWRYYAKVSVAKVRDGEPGFLDLWYADVHTHFQDWPTDQTVPSHGSGRSKKAKSL